MRVKQIRLVLLCVAVQAWMSAVLRGEDEFPFFEAKIRPLLVNHCYECHSVKHGVVEANFNMDTRIGMLAGGDRGVAIIAGKPDVSLVVKAIKYSHDELEMPPSGRLANDEIQTVIDWISRGAKMPDGEVVLASSTEIDFEQARQHWAFRELVDQRPLKPDGEVVDYWVRRSQRQGKVRTQEEAEATALIRRLSLTITGLPPSYQDVQRYASDPSGEVYAELLSEYLKRPQYGERWARHWLDLVRYTDTTASWLKSTAGAWRYRDWIVSSLNADVAYDRFVRLQFAADQMEDAHADDLGALGMLGLSPTYWKEPRLAPVVLETVIAEEWEERIDMVGRTFLGMSLACARCHDHKFDPVSQRDYYALAGVFANTRILDVPILSASEREDIVAADSEIGDLNRLIHREQLAKGTAEDKSIHEKRIAQAEERIDELKKITEAEVEKVPGVVDASISVIAESDSMSKVVYDEGMMVDIALQHRGNPGTKGEVLGRRFLELFDESATVFVKGSGRSELADAMFQHSSFLMARVVVNRVWGHHFGQHLVSTPSNFGLQGAKPTHPELLDALAARFIENRWSLKWLHRTILESDTFKQTSQFNQRFSRVDPENRMYWSVRRRRLDVESWRDSMLDVSGRLDPQVGGPPIPLTDGTNRRRTIYSLIKRRELDDVLKMHGFPEPTGHSPKREAVDTPLQQLYALNSDFIWECATALAGEFSSEVGQGEIVDKLYEKIYQRRPSEIERNLGVKFLSGEGERVVRLERYVHALLISNEFAFLE